MAANLSPLGGAGWQFFTDQGVVLQGGKLFTYLAGSTTPQATWTDSTQTVPNANPIILNSAGRPPNEVWLANSVPMKFVLKDSQDGVLGTWDNVIGVSSGANPASEWLTSGLTPTYLSGNQFSVPGDQRNTFTPNRRVQFFTSSGTYYGYISSVSFDGTSTTTVSIVGDTVNLDNTLISVNYALLNAVNVSVPQQYVKQGDSVNFSAITATTATFTNLSTGNAVITGGSISGIAGFSVPDFLLKAQGII